MCDLGIWESVWFLTVLPYLVLTTSLFCWTMPLFSGVFKRVFCLWFLLITLLLCWLLSYPLPCWEFSVCWWHCVIWMLLLFVCMLAYAIGLLLIHFNTSSNGLVCVFGCFVVWYCRYVSTVTDVGLMCHLLCVILLPFVVSCMTCVVVMVVVSYVDYCPMGPWSTIFSLDHYSWPYRDRCKDLWSIIVMFMLPF